ncbi:polymeric immunoglobulin receptor-like protein [Labeo rohita]|nr:polymeric immunoglobulin receptor-like protein [Labeo rohita]
MRNIQQSQSGTYWCGIDGPKRSHIGVGFKLKVTAVTAGLYVRDQMLAGFEAGSVTVSCYYHLPKKTGIQWCKLGGACVLESGGLLDGALVEIRNGNGVVSVNMSRLKKEHTGWYWCSVRDLQMPVHITVSTREETTITTFTSTHKTTSSQSTSTGTIKPTGSFTSAQTPRSSERRSLLWLMVLVVFTVSCGAVMMITLCKIRTQDIHTVKKILVQKQQTITIPCSYDQKYTNYPKYMSSGAVWLFSHNVSHSRLSIVDNHKEHFFTATLREAEVSDTGTYWCGFSLPGYDDGTSLYLKVTEAEAGLSVSSQNVSGYEGGNVTIRCHGASHWCTIGGSCVGGDGVFPERTAVSDDGGVLNVTLWPLQKEDSGWYYCSNDVSQMPVYVTVMEAQDFTQFTTNSSQSNTSLQADSWALWLLVLAALLPISVCGAVMLIKAKNKRKQRAESFNLYEGMNKQQLPKGTGKNSEVMCDNLYEIMNGIKQNNQGNVKSNEVGCEDLYEIMTVNKGNTQKYAFSCKYLSAGYFWLLSDYVDFSDQRCRRKTALISDDTSRHIFTVHMDDVQESGYYWCAIQVPSAFDKRAGFFLNVTADSPGLHVNSQNVMGSENGSVTITCYHQGQSIVKWCKFGGQCFTGASGTLDGASVEIRYGPRNTTVRMSGLKMENAGWYCCSTEDLQMPVHIAVDENESNMSPVMAKSVQISPGPRKSPVLRSQDPTHRRYERRRVRPCAFVQRTPFVRGPSEGCSLFASNCSPKESLSAKMAQVRARQTGGEKDREMLSVQAPLFRRE